MVSREKELELVRDILKASPRGLTVTDVAEKLHMSRNSSAKYLEMLLMAGQVDMKTFGSSKIFSLSHRMSLATALSLSSEMIVFIDESLQVVEVNEQFLKFVELPRGKVIGQSIESTSLPLLLHRYILLNIRDTLRGREFVREISVSKGRADYYFKVKIIPAVAHDGRQMAAIIFENITDRKQAELALKESEARYRAIVEDQTEMICRMLPDTTMTFANEAWCRNFQVKREDIIGKKHIDFIPPQYKYLFRKDIDSLHHDRPVNIVETAIVTPDGKKHWMWYSYRGLFGYDQRLAELQIVAHDITDRKRAELALKESEARYRAVVESQTDLIMRMLPDTTITFLNDSCTRYFGVKNADLIGRRFIDFLPPDHQAIMEAKLGEINSDSRFGTAEDTTVPIGSIQRWLQWTYCGIFDESGTLREYQIVARDITERKGVEEEVRATRNMLQLIMDNIPQGIFWKDRSSTYVGCNKIFSKAAGLAAPADIVGKTDRDLPWSPEQTAFFLDCDRRVMENDSPEYHIVEQMREAGGKLAWVETNKVPLRDAQGDVIGIIGTYENITQRKRAEEALQESEDMWRCLAEYNPTSIAVHCNGILVYANPAAINNIGASGPEQVIGRSLLDFIYPDDRQGMIVRIQELMKSDKPGAPRETRMVRMDGTVIEVEITPIPILYRGQKAMLTVNIDVTEHNRALKALRAASEFTAVIINESPEAIITSDSQGIITSANKRAAQLLKYRADDLPGKDIRELLPDGEEFKLWGKRDYVRDFLRKDRTRITLNISISTFDVDGVPGSHVVILKNLS